MPVIIRAECLEVQQVADLDGEATMWIKSTRSGAGSSNCVEIRASGECIWIRDSKDPDGTMLSVGRSAWVAFLVALKQGHISQGDFATLA